MSVAHFVIGLALLAVGLVAVIRREAIVARHERRSQGHPVQVPMAYLIMGVIVVLAGVGQLVAAFV